MPATPRREQPGGENLHADVLVIGGGPGGYTAAFRAADLGREVTLVERHRRLGGVCLHVGCIPSKTLLHLAEVITDAASLREHGVVFDPPRIDARRIRARKEEVVSGLADGLDALARKRGVRVLRGTARFEDPHRVRVDGDERSLQVSFDHAIVAVGSRPVSLPGLPEDHPRVFDSTGALELEEIPRRLLVIGGGIIGLEMAAVYDALGSEVSVVELLPEILPGVDRDLVRPLEERIRRRYAAVLTATKVVGVEDRGGRLRVAFEGEGVPESETFDAILVAVGRRPNADRIDAERAGLEPDPGGFLPVDDRMRTAIPHIFAIGDVARPPLLAHKAMHEGKVAAEVIAGLPAAMDARAIPAVAYTDPEIAWMGLTEGEAKQRGLPFEKAVFPWAASGRARSLGRTEGLTKLLFDPESGRLLGAGIAGRSAGELLAETVLALELGADAEDIALTVHAHPTLSETVALAAEVAAGTVTDLPPARRRKRRE